MGSCTICVPPRIGPGGHAKLYRQYKGVTPRSSPDIRPWHDADTGAGCQVAEAVLYEVLARECGCCCRPGPFEHLPSCLIPSTSLMDAWTCLHIYIFARQEGNCCNMLVSRSLSWEGRYTKKGKLNGLACHCTALISSTCAMDRPVGHMVLLI